MGRGKDAFRRGNLVYAQQGGLILPRRGQVQRRQGRDAFLEERLKGTDPWIAVKTARKRIAMQEVGQGQKSHALVMGHIRLDYHPALAHPLRLPAEIHGLVIPVIRKQPQPGQLFQIPHGLIGRQVQGQQGGIGSDDQLFLQAAFQAEQRNAEGLVLIGFVEVHIAEGGFGNTPRHAPLTAIGDLDLHRFPGRLVQKRVAVGVLEQKRHQVFEHGPGPTEQHPLSADGPIQSAHGKPMLQRDIAPGNGNETPEPRLAGQKIVTGSVQNVGGDIEADGKQFAFPVIEKSHVQGCGQRTNILTEPGRHSQGFPGQPLRGGECLDNPVEPGGEVGACLERFLSAHAKNRD